MFPFETVNWSRHPPYHHKITLGRGNDHHNDAFDINATSEKPPASISQPTIEKDQEEIDQDYYHDYYEQEQDYPGENFFVSFYELHKALK